MTFMEKAGTGLGLWLLLAALINAGEHRWLVCATILSLASGIFVWVFGRSSDREAARQKRENAALLDRLEYEMNQEDATGEYIRDRQGFWVRKPAERDLGDGDRDDQDRDQRGGEGAVR
ncbi:membrane protein [Gordonia phage Outis]|nr:membrane protein [Gordonia phage StarStruck]WKW84989.1 membrane protein [Gordonia phage Outis]